MRNRVARVARATIATSRPKSSDSVADIGGTILSTLYGARFLCVEEHSAHQEHKNARTCRPGFPALLVYFHCYCTMPFLFVPQAFFCLNELAPQLIQIGVA